MPWSGTARAWRVRPGVWPRPAEPPAYEEPGWLRRCASHQPPEQLRAGSVAGQTFRERTEYEAKGSRGLMQGSLADEICFRREHVVPSTTIYQTGDG